MNAPAQNRILFENVSKFYGEVLGVNRVNLSLSAGVTSLVGPNGSGKNTLMNLMTGLIRPTNGVIMLDEPLNGLDPRARAASMALFEALGKEGMHVVISSHILHEVDRISDEVVLISSGYIVAEGKIPDVRTEVKEHPMQILVRCAQPELLASRVFAQNHAVEAKLQLDGKGILIRTTNADEFYSLLNRPIVDHGIQLKPVPPPAEDVNSVYQYLIGSDGERI